MLARLLLCLFLLVCAAPAYIQSQSPAYAQSQCKMPHTVVVTYPPGSASDNPARVVVEKMNESLNPRIVVENKAGAGSKIGVRYAIDQAAGCYLLFAGFEAIPVVDQLWNYVGYNPQRDLIPIMLLMEQDNVVLVNKTLPVNTLPELAAYSKTRQLKYGSAGTGSGSHLACAQLAVLADVNMQHIPYRGMPNAMNDTISGEIDLVCAFAAVAKGQIEQNTLKAIVTLRSTRTPFLPAVPSSREQGFPGLEARYWIAAFMRSGTPDLVVHNVRRVLTQALDDQTTRERLGNIAVQAVEPHRRTQPHLQQLLRTQAELWKETIRVALGNRKLDD